MAEPTGGSRVIKVDGRISPPVYRPQRIAPQLKTAPPPPAYRPLSFPSQSGIVQRAGVGFEIVVNKKKEKKAAMVAKAPTDAMVVMNDALAHLRAWTAVEDSDPEWGPTVSLAVGREIVLLAVPNGFEPVRLRDEPRKAGANLRKRTSGKLFNYHVYLTKTYEYKREK